MMSIIWDKCSSNNRIELLESLFAASGITDTLVKKNVSLVEFASLKDVLQKQT